MARATGQTLPPAASLRAVGSGRHIVLLTVGLVVLAGTLSGGAALWRTNQFDGSSHDALEDELANVGYAYGITTTAFVQALGADAAAVLNELTTRAASGEGTIEGFDNHLTGFQLWLPDAASPSGYRLAANTLLDENHPADPALSSRIAAQAAAQDAPAVAVDDGREQINVAFPMQLGTGAPAIVVGTLDAHNEFAFLERQRTEAFRNAIITSVAIFGMLAVVAAVLSTLLARHLVDRDRAEQAVRASEERYRTLASLSPVGIFRADGDGNCIYANERACEIIGLPESEALGQGWAKGLHPDDAERVLNEWSSSSPVAPFLTEYRLVRPDGSTVWVLGQRAPERDEHGAITCFVGTITDITDRKRMEEALREQTRRDPLTGALNHAAIVEELRGVLAATRDGAHCAVAMADIDGMKATNDTFGHQMGDAALVTVARAMAIDSALLGRYGGDEFIAILAGADREAAERYRERVSARLNEATLKDPQTGAHVPILASIGLALYPDDAATVADLIKRSDAAMYAMRRVRGPSPARRGMRPRGDDRAARQIGRIVPLLTAPGTLEDHLHRVAQQLCLDAKYDVVGVRLNAAGGGPASRAAGSVDERLIAAWNDYLAQDHVAEPMRRQLEAAARPLLIETPTEYALLPPQLRQLLGRAGIRSGMVAPMIWGERVVGSIAAGSKREHAFGARDAQLLMAVAKQVAGVLQLGRTDAAGEPAASEPGGRAA